MNKTLFHLSAIALWVTFWPMGYSQNVPKELNTSSQAQIRFEDDAIEKPIGIDLTQEHAALRKAYFQSQQYKVADKLIEKLRYNDAVALYKSLLEFDTIPDYQLMKRIGEAHYYAMQMEESYTWFNALHEKHRDKMDPTDLHQYAQALRALGKFNKAAHVAAQSKKKAGEPSQNPLKNEVVSTNPHRLPGWDFDFSGLHIENLPINTPYADIAPLLDPEGRLVFASAEEPNQKPTWFTKNNPQRYDLYVLGHSPRVAAATRKLAGPINTEYNESSAVYSNDGNTLYFSRSSPVNAMLENGYCLAKIYRSEKRDAQWSTPVPVPFSSDFYTTEQPALSPDGSKLYFVSDMPGSIGGTDIFMVTLYANGSFSTPKNLGPKINTALDECAPFITNGSLYFSSDGHPGLGGLDVYVASLDDQNGFGRVQNIGKPINSSSNDLYFSIDAPSGTGFFASNRHGGQGELDIYAFGPPNKKE